MTEIIGSISTAQVQEISNNIKALNDRLNETLTSTQNKVQALLNQWEGDAAQTTIAAYNSFAAKYFNTYHQMMNEYVLYLNRNVVQGYSELAEAQKSLANQEI